MLNIDFLKKIKVFDGLNDNQLKLENSVNLQ